MVRINLLPSGKKKAVIVPPSIIYGVIAFVILIIITVTITFFLNKRIAGMETEIAIQEQNLNNLKSKLTEVRNYENDNQEFRNKTNIIEQLKKNQIVPLRLLDEVSEMLPKGVWLTELADKGSIVSIQGYAHTNYDLVTYVQNLKGSKYLENVSLIESRQTDVEKFSIYKFKLTFKVKV